jgi:predicted polyphosphate/ATP-dependent NAD kinase
MARYRIGLIVNPIAGMGGAVGLKGTDGTLALAEARRRGATAQAPTRARLALAELVGLRERVQILTGPAELGADIASAGGFAVEALGQTPGRLTGEATRGLARRLVERQVDLILFAGGDGTARDILASVGQTVPILGIPSGVKMHSGVFATGPATAGRLAALLSTGVRCPLAEAEIMDIDEDALRDGSLTARLHGYALVPIERHSIQSPKAGVFPSDDSAVEGAARAIASEMLDGVTYVVGPGRSAKRVLAALCHESHLLGVDVVRDGALIGRDLSEGQLMASLGKGPVALIVGVTGGQGYLFGRGNQPIAPRVIRRALPALLAIAGPHKLAALPQARLLVDTGDPALDCALSGYRRVRCGRNEWMMIRVDTG